MFKNRTAHTIQKTGVILSVICAIHCALTPILITMLPIVSAQFFSSHFMEFGLVAFSIGFGYIGVIRSVKKGHPVATAVILISSGAALILISHLVGHHQPVLIITILGGLLLAAGQVVNIRTWNRCPTCATVEE